MEDIIGAVFSAIYRTVMAVIRFPLVLVLVAVGIGASMVGGVAGWLGFIGASLVTTAVFKRFLRRDIKKTMAGWLSIHLIPVAWSVVYFADLERELLGIGLGVGWSIALAIVWWKVPSRPPAAVARPPDRDVAEPPARS